MTKKEISQIIEIDQLNMSKLYSHSGKDFDVELRKTGIKNEIDKGAVFYFTKENENIIGYVEYTPTLQKPEGFRAKAPRVPP
jgi:hypothetical protein